MTGHGCHPTPYPQGYAGQVAGGLTLFLPILTYATEGAGKRDVTLDVCGLHLPKVADQSSMTSGRLAVWSNDLLLELVGDGFVDAQHVASLLWYAQERVGQRALASVR